MLHKQYSNFSEVPIFTVVIGSSKSKTFKALASKLISNNNVNNKNQLASSSEPFSSGKTFSKF